MPKCIAILGAESSGKTELTQNLAHYYDSDAVFEYARDYMTEATISQEDLDIIAHKQYSIENFVRQNSRSEYIFFDTEMINLKVWYEYQYGSAPDWLAELDLNARYDLYLVTANDLPWQEDTLRSMPDLADREALKSRYIAEIESADIDYRLISGTGQDRIHNAINAIEVWNKS